MSLLFRRHQRPAARHTRHDGLYRCVLIFTYAGKPVVQDNGAVSKQQAMQQWQWCIASGGYQPDSDRRALVMADADYQHLLGGA